MNAYTTTTYQISLRNLDSCCYEIIVSHVNYSDISLEIEGRHLLLHPAGVFLITDQGLLRVRRNSDDLWDCIPKVDLGSDEPQICYADIDEAREVYDLIEKRILEVYPDWGKPIPGRRK